MTMTTDTTKILDHVIWIVEQLDADGLHEMRDVPMLELAKHISRAAAPQRDRPVSRR
jgi:hypothetical protein